MKTNKNELVMHKGCEGCTKICMFNKPVTTKEKNKSSQIKKYKCHS